MQHLPMTLHLGPFAQRRQLQRPQQNLPEMADELRLIGGGIRHDRLGSRSRRIAAPARSYIRGHTRGPDIRVSLIAAGWGLIEFRAAKSKANVGV